MLKSKSETAVKEIVKRNWFICVIVFVCVIKQILVCGLPIYARDATGVDQWKLLFDAENILSGNYITQYHAGTLFKKAVSFPLFLAACNWIGISYLAGYTLLYTIACLLVCFVFRKMTNNKVVILAAFIFLLFTPTSYNTIVQLVYNLSFTIPLAVGMLASLMLVYLNKKNLLSFTGIAWSTVAGIWSAAIWLNREDSMWILPLLGMYMITMAIELAKDRHSTRERLCRGGIICIPLLIVLISNFVYSYINYKGYGIFATNDYTETNFAKAYTSILKVRPSSYPESCSITHETLSMICDVSPAMKELEIYIEEGYDERGPYITAGRDPDDGEIEDGWMNFFLREAASKAGYYSSAISADEFWGRVSDEIEAALEEGMLPERSVAFFGSVLQHPWRNDAHYMEKWIKSIVDFVKVSVLHSNEKAAVIYNTVGDEIADRYEAMTLNYTVSVPKNVFSCGGWLFCQGINEPYQLRLVNGKGEIYQNIEWQRSDDIKEAYGSTGANLDSCRFILNCQIQTNQQMYFEISFQSGEVFAQIPIENAAGVHENIVNYNGQSILILYGLDKEPLSQQGDADEKYAQERVNRVNSIGRLYQRTGVFLFAVAVVVYIYVSYNLIRTKKDKNIYLSEWMFMSAIIGSMLVLIIALSYNDAFRWGTIWYICPVTALVDFLCSVSIVCLGNIITNLYSQKNESELKNGK